MSGPHPFDPYQVFQRSAQRFPERPALRIGEREWSYAELERAAAQVAGWCDRRTEHGARIAVHGRKGFLAYAGILGVLRSGRSYVPLHPEHPAARWHTVIGRSHAAACIVEQEQAASFEGIEGLRLMTAIDEGGHGPVREGTESYVMFTSGSTGVPKGVAVSRANVAAYLEHFPLRAQFNEHDRFSQVFALTFDLSVHDLFLCWSVGACLCVPEAEAALGIPTYIITQGITVWFSVPSLITLMHRMRVLRPNAFEGIRHSFFCGEALSWERSDVWRQAASRSTLTNLYGPTEATIAISACTVGPDRSAGEVNVPLGKVIGHNRMRIADADANGEGELWLSGPQVTGGYLDAPETTAQAFVASGGMTWYRTGDRAVQDAAGEFHFRGRLDDQVKILGHRVEPGEVDAVLSRHLPQGTSLTLAVDLKGTTRLVTFIDVAMDTAPLLEELRLELPPYMVPERIVPVEGFPLTAHGKVDRKALLQALANG
ncbi:MAG TPA: AMP-binding protein [Flavobacteriales bacterium]